MPGTVLSIVTTYAWTGSAYVLPSAMAKAGVRGAQTAQELASDPGKFLSTVQIGITLVAIVAGAYSGASLGEPVSARFKALGLSDSMAHTLGFALVIGLTGYASLVIGELVPKRVGQVHPETVARLVARPMRWVAVVAQRVMVGVVGVLLTVSEGPPRVRSSTKVKVVVVGAVTTV